MTTKFQTNFPAKIFLIIIFLLTAVISKKINAQEHWQRLPGPSHSVVYDFLGTNSGDILCGTFMGGLYSTKDKGKNWNQIANSVDNYSSNYFSKINDGNFLSASSGVLKSTDDGETWIIIGLGDEPIMSVAAYSDSIFIAGGVNPKTFRTSDGGANWNELFTDSINTGTVYSLSVEDGVIYYAGVDRVYKSLDSGISWINITPNNHYTTYYDLVVTNNNILFCASDDSISKIYKSSDFGETWTAAGFGITTGYVRKLVSVDNYIIAGTPSGIFVSTDEGESWTLKADYFSTGSIRALKVIDNEIYAGTYFGGAYKSTDNGESWIEINSGLDACSIQNFFTANNTFYAFAGFGGLSYSLNSGDSWSIVLRNSSFSNIAFGSNGYLFGSTYMHGVMRSTNDGHYWEFINSGISDTAIIKILVNQQDVIFARSSTGRLFRSTNFGDDWIELTNSQYPGFSDIFITPQNLLLAYNSENIFISSDNGSSWITNSYSTHFTISKLFILDDSKIYVISYQDSLFITTDLGDNWSLLNPDLPSYASNLVQDKRDRLFLISGDIYVSEDGGISWNILNSGIENKNILKLGVDQSGVVYAGTSFEGTYKLVDTPVLVEVLGENFIDDFELSQNYPNPFNPSTMIRFNLPVSGLVTLKVYDILGKEVAVLLNESKTKGNYEVEFSPDNIPSGVYFYTLAVGEFKETRKMLYLK